MDPDRMAGQRGQRGDIEKLGSVRSGDNAYVPPLALGEADEFGELPRRRPAAADDIEDR